MNILNKIFIALLVLLLFTCETEDNNISDNCRVEKVEPITLYYDYINYFELGAFNPNFEGIIIEYDAQHKIQSIIGGPSLIPPGQDLPNVIFTQNITYAFLYSGNTVNVKKFTGLEDDYIQNSYVLNNNIIISRSIINDSSYSDELHEYTYNYSDDIIEEYEGARLNRILHLENGNLIKIEKLFYSPEQVLFKKTEIIFSGYDNTDNLLKGKFFIDGNFYKAFSRNNFNSVEKNTFSFDGNEFVPISVGETYRNFESVVNENGINSIFQQVCDD